MDLQSVTIEGFRKFEESTVLHTTGKLVALLGPNEAGKTSILKALSTIGKPGAISESDISRSKNYENSHEVISAKFKLGKEDLEAANLSSPTWYHWSLTIEGKTLFRFEPRIAKRSLSPRKKLGSELERVRSNNSLWGRLVNEHAELLDSFDSILAILARTEQTLEQEEIEDIRSFGRRIGSAVTDGDPKYFSNISALVNETIKHEESETPTQFAQRKIRERLPKILFFSNEERLLQGTYDVEEFSNSVPPALENIAKVAGLDLQEMAEAIEGDDMPAIARLKAKANEELKKRFSETWSQSGIHVAFEVNNNQLQVLVQEENYNFTKLAERSDGLRQFVALQAFTTCERAENPILLIDEAEMRLHYDAQADLVQMLAKQTVSPKIIYTTHSAGCLPEDLGNGVRVIQTETKEDGSQKSSVRNHFWSRTQGGLEPLLFGMGAATLAFFPVRKALLTEGESDMILLPSMFREAFNRDYLTFQVVPGISKTSGINLPILARNGTGVAFALDHDGGGKELKKKIVKAGFDENTIFFLKAAARGDSQIEDFINPQVLISAVRLLAEEIGRDLPNISASKLPSRARLEKVAEWLGYRKPSEIPKTLLAYKVLEAFTQKSEAGLIDPRKKQAFNKFARQVSDFMISQSTS